jgi:hypothetical protein
MVWVDARLQEHLPQDSTGWPNEGSLSGFFVGAIGFTNEEDVGVRIASTFHLV